MVSITLSKNIQRDRQSCAVVLPQMDKKQIAFILLVFSESSIKCGVRTHAQKHPWPACLLTPDDT